jgi:hypothetical protein
VVAVPGLDGVHGPAGGDERPGPVRRGRVLLPGHPPQAYLDTRRKLGGYLLEVIVARGAPAGAPAAAPLDRFELDLTTKARGNPDGPAR